MQDHPRRIGRTTFAIGLIVLGAALLLDNLLPLGRSITVLVLRLWPLLLIGLGIEVLRVPRPRRFDFAGALLLLLLVGAILSLQWVGTRRSESFGVSAEGARAVAVTLELGRVEIRPQAGEEVRVDAYYGVPGLLYKARAFDLAVEPGETIRITGRAPQGIGLGRLSATYYIYLPAGLDVQVETRAGSIGVRDYEGNLRLRTGAGSIRVDSSSGTLDAQTDSGSITIHGFDGKAAAVNRIGGIGLRQVSGDLLADSGTGSIEVVEFRGRLAAETGTGSIRAETSTPLEGDLRLRTSTGSIQLTLPAASDARVTAQTEYGSITAPSFLAVTKSGAVSSGEGALGAGTYEVCLETRMGSIELVTR